jgi:hypothetical protein
MAAADNITLTNRISSTRRRACSASEETENKKFCIWNIRFFYIIDPQKRDFREESAP